MDKDFKPFILEVNTRQEALFLKTAVGMMTSNLSGQVLFGKILVGLGELTFPPERGVDKSMNTVYTAHHSIHIEKPTEFPILSEFHKWRKSVPWSLIAPHEPQAKHNHSQSLEHLAKRGGLSPRELYAVIKGVKWSNQMILDMSEEEAQKIIDNMIIDSRGVGTPSSNIYTNGLKA